MLVILQIERLDFPQPLEICISSELDTRSEFISANGDALAFQVNGVDDICKSIELGEVFRIVEIFWGTAVCFDLFLD